MLPSILEVAREHGLYQDERTLNKKEIRFKCPFCAGDKGKEDKYYLSLNVEDNVFKCWLCDESGGVLKFIALLQGKSVEEVKQDLWGDRKKPQRKLHPAERLTPAQLKMLGMKGPGWYALRKRDYALYRRTLNWVWTEWKEFVATEKRDAYMRFYATEDTGLRKKICCETAAALSLNSSELMMEFLNIKLAKNKPQWAKDAENFVHAMRKDLVSPELTQRAG